jgi:hypothetical protein
MKFRKSILPNGDLRITANNKARAWLKEVLAEVSVVELWPCLAEILEYDYPWLRFAWPEELGALTSAPILLEISDKGEDLFSPRVWWYPNYQIKDELGILKKTGRLVMTLAEEY